MEQNSFRNEIQKINNEMDEIMNKKLDKKEYENFKNKVLLDIEQKVNFYIILVRSKRFRKPLQEYSK